MKILLIIISIGTILGLLMGILGIYFKNKEKKGAKISILSIINILSKYIAFLIIIAISIVSYFISEKIYFPISLKEETPPIAYITGLSNMGITNAAELQSSSLSSSLEENINKGPLTSEDCVLANITLLSSFPDVQNKFSIIPKKEEGLYSTLYYFDNDIEVIVSRVTNKVAGIYLLSTKYKTARGITVGDKDEKIILLYGKPHDKLDLGDIPDIPDCYAYEYYHYKEKKIDMILRFVINNNSKNIIYIGIRKTYE